MTKATPVVYLLHGEDEYAIAQYVSEIETKLGDPAMAAMNTTRLDGRSYNLDDLLSVASAMPFLSKRRLVVVTNPLSRLATPQARQKFLDQLNQVPVTTALLLIEYKLLTEEKEKNKGKVHWLEKWAREAGERVLLRAFPLPKGPAMGRWIENQARAAGGQFTPDAAALLATLVGDEPRLANQEVEKLLIYVNYQRAVEAEDVENLTADTRPGDIFKMVDALGNRDGRGAISMLHRLLEEQDPISIFGMVVRQFRLLLLAREVLDQRGQAVDVARALKIHPFVADKVSAQARHFSLPVLEAVYHRLLELDLAMKTSQINPDLAMDTFVAAFTNQPR